MMTLKAMQYLTASAAVAVAVAVIGGLFFHNTATPQALSTHQVADINARWVVPVAEEAPAPTKKVSPEQAARQLAETQLLQSASGVGALKFCSLVGFLVDSPAGASAYARLTTIFTSTEWSGLGMMANQAYVQSHNGIYFKVVPDPEDGGWMLQDIPVTDKDMCQVIADDLTALMAPGKILDVKPAGQEDAAEPAPATKG